MRKIKIADKYIGDDEPTFIIAEAGSNHNGNLEQAKKLIDIAADAQADAVKFQLFKAEMLYPKNCGFVEMQNGKVDLFGILKKLEFPLTWLDILKEYSEKKSLVFLCSCFDEESAEALENIGIEAYKFASPELNHIPLLEFIGKKKKPIIMSTGISKLGDIEEAIDTYVKQGNEQVILLHCVSAYPTPLEDCNLNIIKTLKTAFDVPVGFSDHTIDPIAASGIAVFIGANVIEKHFTISKKIDGPDHGFSLEPNELKKMIQTIRKMETMDKKEQDSFIKHLYGNEKINSILGVYQKIIAPSEKILYPNDKRSIHAIKDMIKGETLTKEKISILRSERNLNSGLHPRFYKLLLGSRIQRSVKYGAGIIWEDLLQNEQNKREAKNIEENENH